MTAQTPVRRERIVFTGRVQGVGFRYTTNSIARRYPIGGFVRNQPDGTVEVIVQGETAAINAFLADIAHHFRGNISHTDRTPLAACDQFAEFEVRF